MSLLFARVKATFNLRLLSNNEDVEDFLLTLLLLDYSA